MKLSILNHLALKSIQSHPRLFFPFTLATTILFAVEFILLSLMENQYIQEKSSDVRTILGIGLFFGTILIIIIAVYGASFVRKQLSREYGLYSVLGLEKNHLVYISMIQLFIIFMISGFFAIILGYLCGHLVFRALNLAMQNTGMTLMDYPLSGEVILKVLGVLAITFIVIFLIWVFNILSLHPIELLKSGQKVERQPKSKWLTLVAGILFIGCGYYIALTEASILQSIVKIYLAITLVIIGTFLLFLSLISIVLKALQNSDRYYQHPNWFISISGMLSRIQNSAVSLASIAILMSGVFLVMTMTLTVYQTIEDQVKKSQPMDYSVNIDSARGEDEQENLEIILSSLVEKIDITDKVFVKEIVTRAVYAGDQIVSYKDFKADENSGSMIYLIVQPLDAYNDLLDKTETLQENELMIASNFIDVSHLSSLKIGEKNYELSHGDADIIPGQYAVEVVYLAVPNESAFDHLLEHFGWTLLDGQLVNIEPDYKIHFNSLNESRVVMETIKALQENVNHSDSGVIISSFGSKKDRERSLYELNGGIIFIGIIVSILCVVGTILLLYYKQISEGQMDRGKFDIMKKVGLPEKLIKKSTNIQIFWIFGLPIIVAVIHNIVASKLVIKLLGILGLQNPAIYGMNLAIVTVVFGVIYMIAYLFSSRTYYDIVNQ